MNMVRLIASPAGDIACDADLAAMPLDGCPSGLTYAAYFQGIEAFLGQDDFAALRQALGGSLEAARIEVRAQKHGALYHPASVTVVAAAGSQTVCVNVAATPLAAQCLAGEAELLSGLRSRFTPDFLPQPHAFGQSDPWAFLLEQWFTGFHEFHLDGAGRVRLWDFETGERTLSPAEAMALYRETARILTRYYDADTGAAIFPWHHAAGDFVARVADGTVAARLVTVRGYGAHRDFSQAGDMAGKLAALSFFTNLTMRVRLDRVDGVGELVLAGENAARAAVEGFAVGLRERSDLEDRAEGILSFLASFAPEELAGAAAQLADPCPPEETELLAGAWPGHAVAVGQALQACLEGQARLGKTI